MQRTCAVRTASRCTNFKDRAIVDLGGVRIGLTGAAYDQTPRVSSSEDLKFLPTVAAMKEQARRCCGSEGADFVVAVMHADRRQGVELCATTAADLILTGHNHDLFVNTTAASPWRSRAMTRHYVTDDRRHHRRRDRRWPPRP